MTGTKKQKAKDGVQERIPTGVPGLDEILHGGLIEGRTYLIRGDPGTGKTITGFHFLAEGLRQGESSLLVHLEENEEDLRQNAASLGIDLDGLEIVDLAPGSEAFEEAESYDVFEPAEAEAEELVQRIVGAMEEHDPARVVLDPASQLRYLSQDLYRFRKRLVGLKHYVQESDATLLLPASSRDEEIVSALQYITDGCIALEHHDWGRSVRVTKFRGSGIEGGSHDLSISGEGLEVHPILVPMEHGREVAMETIPSGIDALDQMLWGGIERGTVTVIAGPSGVGKSTVATQFAKETATRGERSAMYLFEESLRTFRHRNEALGTPVGEMMDDGTLMIEVVEPLRRSPDEFARRVRQEVEQEDVKLVVLDAVGGYRLSLRGPDEDVNRRLHSLARYLKNMGVTTIIIDEVSEIAGGFKPTGTGISYLADNILFLRHVELKGELRKVIGALKKRMTPVDPSIRQLSIDDDGLQVGGRLEGIHGVLGGVPRMLEDRED